MVRFPSSSQREHFKVQRTVGKRTKNTTLVKIRVFFAVIWNYGTEEASPPVGVTGGSMTARALRTETLYRDMLRELLLPTECPVTVGTHL